MVLQGTTTKTQDTDNDNQAMEISTKDLDNHPEWEPPIDLVVLHGDSEVDSEEMDLEVDTMELDESTKLNNMRMMDPMETMIMDTKTTKWTRIMDKNTMDKNTMDKV